MQVRFCALPLASCHSAGFQSSCKANTDTQSTHARADSSSVTQVWPLLTGPDQARRPVERQCGLRSACPRQATSGPDLHCTATRLCEPARFLFCAQTIPACPHSSFPLWQPTSLGSRGIQAHCRCQRCGLFDSRTQRTDVRALSPPWISSDAAVFAALWLVSASSLRASWPSACLWRPRRLLRLVLPTQSSALVCLPVLSQILRLSGVSTQSAGRRRLESWWCLQTLYCCAAAGLHLAQ